MCGIIGAVSGRNVVPLLMDGLRRLEYRGYDSAGLAVVKQDGRLSRRRAVGKVSALQALLDEDSDRGSIGIAHTRWATHGVPCERNAHPHVSNERIALVHNGIIENHSALRTELQKLGYRFESDTDTEVAVHLIDHCLQNAPDMLSAVRAATRRLEGSYAIAVVVRNDPDRIIVARAGCPVIIGLGAEQNFVSSDVSALLPVTRRFMLLEDGDVAEVSRMSVRVSDSGGARVERPVRESELTAEAAEKGAYSHFMLKEIYEQPRAIAGTLSGRIADGRLLENSFGPDATSVFARVEHVHIVACGTSYHAGAVARYFIEQLCRLPCTVELASEYRYRHPVTPRGSLFVAISQSGETADTLAALRMAKEHGYLASLAICNVPESSLVRESELVLLTRAGLEVGVASTKAFTTQLAALVMLAIALLRTRTCNPDLERELVSQLHSLPRAIEAALALEPSIEVVASRLAPARHALFLGRGAMYPIAMEGALKLKEISYIHAEAYAAGELKHGPLALVDDAMPVIALAPNDGVVEKLKSNLMEVRARGGQLYAFTDRESGIVSDEGVVSITMPSCLKQLQMPIVYTVALQLLAYHVALLKGNDVDQPRNLAKSVTVE